MIYSIKDILEAQKQIDIEGVPPNMIYRKETDNKVIKKAFIMCLCLITSIITIIYTTVLYITSHLLGYIIACIFPILSLIILFRYLDLGYVLYQFMNQGYKIKFKDGKLIYKCGFITKTFNIPFAICYCDIPVAVHYYEECLILSDIANSETAKSPDFNVFFNDPNLTLRYDTVNEEGKSLLDFLMEANALFIGNQQEAP